MVKPELPDDVGKPLFPTTQWEDLPRDSGDAAKLDVLLARYLGPLKAWLVWGKRWNPQDADDLLQSFVLDKLLCGRLLRDADQKRGRFRSLLLTALDRYARGHHRKRHALKRAPDIGISLDAGALDIGEDAADSTYEIAWAVSVLTETLERVREECRQKGRADLWRIWDARVVRPLAGEASKSYEQLVGEEAYALQRQSRNAMETLKRMFRRSFCQYLTELGHEDPDNELRDFFKILGQSGAALSARLRNVAWEDLPDVTMGTEDLTDTQRAALTILFESPRSEPLDLAASWRQVLESQLIVQTAVPSPDRQPSQLKVAQVLDGMERGIEPTELVKRFAKRNRTDADSPFPREVSTALYYAAVARALVQYGRKITRLDDQTLAEGFAWLLEQDWIDDSTRQLVQRAANS